MKEITLIASKKGTRLVMYQMCTISLDLVLKSEVFYL